MLNFFQLDRNPLAKLLDRRKQQMRNLSQAVDGLTGYGITSEVSGRLQTFLQIEDSREVYHANPRRIAEQLQLNEQQTLRLLVFALKEGIVTLNWDIRCNYCGGVDLSIKQLGELHTHHTCPGCRQSALTDADQTVRVTFSIDERLRPLDLSADDPEFRARIDAQYGVVSGHRLLTLQTFRNLFPRETIPPNESLIVRRVAILFTDLAGSTALYSRRGDTIAYSLVRHHFDHLFTVVDDCNGVVIKTIGDAIMAAFTEPADALRAAILMHRELAQLNQQLQLASEDQLILKVGIEAGPCISVNLNGRLDYFGTTVNTAARVQATSQGNDIAVTGTFLEDPTAGALVKDYVGQPSQLQLKGLDEPVVVYYLHPSAILV